MYAWNLFVKKKKNSFGFVLITSFTILLRTLFGVVLLGELVLGCVSFCGISFIVVGVGNCDSDVSSVVVDDSSVVCEGLLFCCADSFSSLTSGVLFGFRLRSGCPSYIRCTHLPKMWTASWKFLLCRSIYIIAFRYAR